MQSNIHLKTHEISKRYRTTQALNSVSLEVERGSFVCLLGPSGCGKTTLLRIIAGFEPTSGGKVLLDGVDITNQPAYSRGFGMVFQSLALFPHMSVAQNIAYGLKVRKASKSEQNARVEELLHIIELPDIANRPVSALSGGQQQRVAIARALAIRPSVFLLDEPLSALDAKLRESMQIELRRLQQRFGVTTILVTHDQSEAMMLADQLVVMKDGCVRQVGQPAQVYRHPADSFVADFLGSANLVSAVIGADRQVIVFGNDTDQITDFAPNTSVVIAVRPEDLRLIDIDGDQSDGLTVEVQFYRDLGSLTEWIVTIDGADLRVRLPHSSSPAARPGEQAKLIIPENCHVYKNE